MLRLKALGWGVERIAARARLQPHDGAAVPGRGRLGGLSDAAAGRGRWTGSRTGWRSGSGGIAAMPTWSARSCWPSTAIGVSLRTVERAVAPLRRELAAEARATVRFETPPGQQLQIDFGERRVDDRRRAGQGVPVRRDAGLFAAAACAGVPQRAPGELVRGAGGRLPALRRGDRRRCCSTTPGRWSPATTAATREVAFNDRLHAFASTGASGRGPARRTGRAPRARTSAASATSSATRSPAGASTSWAALEAHLERWMREVADVRVHGTTGEAPIARFARDGGGGAAAARRPAAVPAAPRAGAPGAGRLLRRGRRQRLQRAVAADRRSGARGRVAGDGCASSMPAARSRCTPRGPAGASAPSIRPTSRASSGSGAGAVSRTAPGAPTVAARTRAAAAAGRIRGGWPGAAGDGPEPRSAGADADAAEADGDPRSARQPARRGGAPRADAARGADAAVRARDRAQGRAADRDGDRRSPSSRSCATSTASTSPPSPRSTRSRSASSRPAASSPMARRCCCSGRPGSARRIWRSRSAARRSGRLLGAVRLGDGAGGRSSPRRMPRAGSRSG